MHRTGGRGRLTVAPGPPSGVTRGSFSGSAVGVPRDWWLSKTARVSRKGANLIFRFSPRQNHVGEEADQGLLHGQPGWSASTSRMICNEPAAHLIYVEPRIATTGPRPGARNHSKLSAWPDLLISIGPRLDSPSPASPCDAESPDAHYFPEP